jgi:hypothetical protein
LVGSPYTGHYRRASIVHDKACDDAKGAADPASARAAADRMFYDACREGGCNWFEAVCLYVGVRVGAYVSQVAPELLAEPESPAIARPQDQSIIDIYQSITQQVTQAGETDDATEVERRTDAAMARWAQIRAAQLRMI